MENITNDDHLYRRLHPGFIKHNGEISSSAFHDDSGKVSVDLAKLTSPEESVARSKGNGYGLADLIVVRIRELGFDVFHDPIETNYSHCIIDNVITKADQRKLARVATTLISPRKNDWKS